MFEWTIVSVPPLKCVWQCVVSIVGVAGILFPFVPGGIGVNEGAAVLALTVTGYGESLGLAIGLSRRARQLLLAAAGVAFHALGRPRT